jgi:pimeloyl-ACP methyl ester carboxylesterase
MRIRSGTASLSVDVLEGAGTPVLLVHGLGGSRVTWLELPRSLARSRRVIAPDLRGCGDSERGAEPYSFALLATDAIAVLDALNVDRCHVLGHSLGGVVAQELLTTHNERLISAVLISTSSRVGAAAAGGWLRLADTVERRGFGSPEAAAARGFSADFANEHPELVQTLGRVTVASDRTVYAEQARIAAHYDYTDALTRVAQPVLVVQGLADRLTSPGGSVIMSRALPAARLEMIEGVGHNLHIELGERFAALVEEFFDAVENGTRSG